MSEPAAPDARKGEGRFGAVVVLLGVVLTNLGVWRAGIPFEDESSHINDGFRVLRGEHSTNLYSLLYGALLGTVAPDPMDAHVIMRFVASVGSTLGLFYVLRAFRGLRSTAIVVASLVWGCSALCTPPTQNGNICVFSLALILPALGYVLRETSALSLFTFALAAFWTAQVRPEYLAPMILIPVGGVIYLRRKRRHASNGEVPSNRGRRWKTVLVAAALVASFPVASAFRSPTKTKVGAYLLLGLGQCYAAYYGDRHPEEHFTAMTEYEPILNRVFGNPRSFMDAAANNPRELVRYLAANGFHNLIKVPRALVSSRNKLYNVIVLGFIVVGGTIGLRSLRRRQQDDRPLMALINSDDLWRLCLLSLFASASSCSILLLVPASRYWISFVPLFYVLLAWSLHNVLSKYFVSIPDRIIRAVAIVVFGFPVFIGVRSDRGLMDVVRAAESGLDHPPVIAGNWVVPFNTFAFKDQAIATGEDSGLTIDELRSRRCDIIVMDSLMQTRFAATNRAYLQQLASSPESVGYRPLPEAAQYGWTLYVREAAR